MPCFSDHVLGVVPFVEGGIVHHDDGVFGQLRQEILPDPCSKDVRRDVDYSVLLPV